MSLAFQAEISPAHVQAATVGVFWRQVLQPLALGAVAVFWLGGHMMLWALFPQAPWLMHAALALLLWVSLLGVAEVASRYYQGLALENFKHFEGAPVQVRLAEDAYHYSASWGTGSVAWDQFQSLWCLKEVWVLLQHAQGGASVLLPVESLDEEAKAFLVARLKAVGAKVPA